MVNILQYYDSSLGRYAAHSRRSKLSRWLVLVLRSVKWTRWTFVVAVSWWQNCEWYCRYYCYITITC